MKHNWKSILSMFLEYVALLGPAAGYCGYAYATTLTYKLSEGQVAGFWAVFGIAIVAVFIVSLTYKRIKQKFSEYRQKYIQQCADLEEEPGNEKLIKLVAQKSKIIESIDYVMLAFPIIIWTLLLYLLQNAIVEVIGILATMSIGLLGKAAVHTLTVHEKEKGAIAKAQINGEVK